MTLHRSNRSTLIDPAQGQYRFNQLVSTERYFDAHAAAYDSLYESPYSLKENAHVAKLLQAYANGNLLDVGCGTGLGFELLGKPAKRYWGCDISVRMVMQARQRFPAVARYFDLGDAQILPYEPNRFDNVVSLFGSLSYVGDLPLAFGEIRDVLRPGGGVFAMLYNRASYWRRLKKVTSPEHIYDVYTTRGADTHYAAEAWFWRGYEVHLVLSELGYRDIRISTMSALANHLEYGWLWGLDRLACRMDDVGHYLIVEARNA